MLPYAVTLANDVKFPAESSLATLTPLKLKKSVDPLGVIDHAPEFAIEVDVPVMLIPQVPVAPVPVTLGTSVPIATPKFVLAAEAEVAAVPPFAIGSVPVEDVEISVCPAVLSVLAN